MPILDDISTSLQEGRAKDVKQLVQQAIDQGLGAQAILEQGLLDGMNIIGAKFRVGEVFVPEVLIAARAMNMGMALLKPLLVSEGVVATGKVVIGTVKGDLHDIGKNLVAMMLKGAGYEVEDLGVDCDVAKFQAAVDRGAQVVLCSALLTTTMPYMKTVTEGLKAKGVKVVIGGAPVTPQYACEIGAAAYGSDANEAVKVVDALVGANR